jgi:hypothetical protein
LAAFFVVPDWTDFAGALLARGAVLAACRALVEPSSGLAADRFAPALAGDLAAVRFTASSVAVLALIAAT